MADPEWNSSAARFARKIGCPTVPLFFNGANSVNFQMLGAIHPRLRTLNLAHELVNKKSHTISVRVGTAVPAAVLKNCPDAEAATDYLAGADLFVIEAALGPAAFCADDSEETERVRSVARSPRRIGWRRKSSDCPGRERWLENSEFKVVLAKAREIPNLLQEIGRCRELTYRAVDEGTGNALDLDVRRVLPALVLWHVADGRLAGAYRLAATPDVLPSYGPKGLYTSTLFRYQPELFERIGPAIELGRSFVWPEYQKLYAPLLLLLEGYCGVCAVGVPSVRFLFGAVSISGEYQPHSRRLMVDHLCQTCGGSELAHLSGRAVVTIDVRWRPNL